MQSLDGKHILLTGASRGIGRALVLRLAREKARLSICGRDLDALSEVAREAEGLGHAPYWKGFDLAQEEAIVRFFAAATEQHGPVDVLINNAGFNSRKAAVWEYTTAEFDAMMAVNLRAPFIFLREAVRSMKERKQGHIVNVLSTVCHFYNEQMGVYTAGKWGLQGLTGTLRKELLEYGVRVSAVYPGGTNTTFRANPRPDYSDPRSVAEAITAVLTLPEDVVVHDLTFRPMVERNF